MSEIIAYRKKHVWAWHVVAYRVAYARPCRVHRSEDQKRIKMPFGIFGGGRKKAYSVQQKQDDQPVLRFASASKYARRNSAPAGILKKSGRSRPQSYPALVDGMVPSEMAAAVPMPSEPELNTMFAELVVSPC